MNENSVASDMVGGDAGRDAMGDNGQNELPTDDQKL